MVQAWQNLFKKICGYVDLIVVFDMVVIKSAEIEMEAVLAAAKLMVASARTAPKGGGRDFITAAIVTGEDKEKIADKMVEMKVGYTPDVNTKESINVRNADAVVLIGAKIEEKDEARQVHRQVDLGIAIGSAVKTASILNIDNRVFATIGMAAMALKLIEGNNAYGIALSVRGSNIFFDREDPIKKAWQQKLPPRK
jgi:uncharacterized ferredoxin-like protein